MPLKFLQTLQIQSKHLQHHFQRPLRGVQETPSLLQESNGGDRPDPAATALSRLGLVYF